MSSYLKLFLSLLFTPALCTAQNWKTVLLNDTTYFTAGTRQISGYFPHGPLREQDSGYLRMTFIDSFQLQGADTVFFFARALRETDTFVFEVCIDTLAPGWLGHKFGRNTGGNEWYLNGYEDTITFKTQANLGDTWLLAKDKTGSVDFWGTISQQASMLIDGTMDSVKTISIQAFSNNMPVANEYNAKQFVLSKDHGWVETLDLFRFPNDTLNPWQGDVPGIQLIDPATHTRLPKEFNRYNRDSVDLAWKYAPGNEWINWVEAYPYPGYYVHIVTHDSIVSSNITAPGTIVVNCYTRKYKVLGSPPPGGSPGPTIFDTTVTSLLHTDTITAAATSYLIADSVLPEYRAIVDGYTTPQYYVSSFCDKFILTSRHVDGHYYAPSLTDPCYVLNTWTDPEMHESQHLQGFGQMYIQDVSMGYYSKYYYSYLKLGACETGQKIDVIALGVDDANLQGQEFSIYPNPANDEVTLSFQRSQAGAVATIYDLYGKKVLEQTLNGLNTTLPASTLSPGVYIVTVTDGSARAVKKLVIQR